MCNKRKRSGSEERDGDRKHLKTAIENPVDDGLDDDMDGLTDVGESDEDSEYEDERRQNQIFNLEYLCYNYNDYHNLLRIDYLIPPPPPPPLPQPLDESELLNNAIPSSREMPDWLPEAVFGHESFVESSIITHDVEAHVRSNSMVEDIVFHLLHLDILMRELFEDAENSDSTTSRGYESWTDE